MISLGSFYATAQSLSKSSTSEVDRLNKLSSEYKDKRDTAKALKLVIQAEKLAKEIHYQEGLADAYLRLGAIYREGNQFEKANRYFHQLMQLSEEIGNETQKGNALDNFGHLYWAQGDTAKALQYHLKALAIRRRIKDQYGIGNSLDNIAYIYSERHDYRNAVMYFQSALKKFKELKDEYRIALISANVGYQYFFMGYNKKALDHFYTSLEYYKAINNTEGEVYTLNFIGNIYSDIGNYNLALKELNRALELNRKQGSTLEVLESYTLIGRTYLIKTDYKKALDYFFKAKELSYQLEDSARMMITDFFIADTYSRQGKSDEALTLFREVNKFAVQMNAINWKAESCDRIGRILYNKKEYREAKNWLEESIKYNQEMHAKGGLSQNYQLLSRIHYALGNYKEAYDAYETHVSLENELKKDEASNLVMKYEFKRKEQETKAEQEKKSALLKREIRTKKIQRNGVILALVLVLLLLFSILYLFRLRTKKLAAEKLNVELKRKEIEAAKETEQFKSRFLANITHEFRTPLTLINGHLELLKKSDDGTNLGRYREMEFHGKRLLELINQLLDLSKMESGQYALTFRKGQLLNEIQAQIQVFHSHAEQLDIDLVCQIHPEIVEQLKQRDFYYSSEALTTILVNLLSNAFKFTPKGGKVQVDVACEGDDLIVHVSDTGIGIPADQIDKVFERFFQVSEGENRFQSGSGIGLALVKELVLMHGGNVSAFNREEGGCTFSFSIKNQHTSENQVSETLVQQKELMLESKKFFENQEDSSVVEDLPLILVVEDQPQLRKLICESLGNSYRFAEAENGEEGVRMAIDLLPDILISDVMMPNKTGVELCAELKNNNITSHIPIILLTAKSDQSDKELGLETGADDYLVKPFSLSELQLRVRNLLRLREQLQLKLGKSSELTTSEAPELNERDRGFLDNLKSFAEENLSNPQLAVNMMADHMCLSTSQLTRKLKALTGNTPAEYIRQIRLQMALKLLKKGMSVTDVSWSVGFEDPSYFGKVFKKQFGVPPSEIM